MEIIVGLLAAALAVAAAVWLYIRAQGDEELTFLFDQRSDFTVEAADDRGMTFSVTIPFINRGSQDGTIMDAFPRILLPAEYYDAATVGSWLTIASRPRTDGYWEACIVFRKTGDAVVVKLIFAAREGRIGDALASLPDFPVEIVYQVVSRRSWYLTKSRLMVPAEELRRAAARAQEGGSR